jgi:hypothetical protein
MNLIDFLREIEVDEHNLRDTLSDLSDSILVTELRKYRQNRIDEYMSVKDGVSINAYVLGDPERDAFEISRRIEAVDMLLEEYIVAHERFDFESVEWWDDKEGLND